jgi:hypothetical protein
MTQNLRGSRIRPAGRRDDVKTCATCGRSFAWRRRWAEVWDDVLYCSQACKRTRPGDLDRLLEAAIVDLLIRRGRSASICPSDAARVVGGDDWQALTARSRRAARRLVAAGTVEITQRGRVVDPSTARGPIRIRLARSRR